MMPRRLASIAIASAALIACQATNEPDGGGGRGGDLSLGEAGSGGGGSGGGGDAGSGGKDPGEGGSGGGILFPGEEACELSILGETLDFGVVAPGGEREQIFGVRNLLETSCILHDLRLTSDSDPSFSLTPRETIELAGQETLRVPVRFAPTRQEGIIEGTVTFSISDEAQPHRTIGLRGGGATTCLLYEVDAVELGQAAPGCSSPPVVVSFRNGCEGEVGVASIELASELDAGDFQLSGLPTLPLVLQAGESATFTARFRPGDLGARAAHVALRFSGWPADDRPDSSQIRLRGEAVPEPIRIDEMRQDTHSKVDVLWVMDNSGSMAPMQAHLAASLGDLLTYASTDGADWHLAVTTTGLELPSSGCPGGAGGAENGRFFPIDGGQPRILSPTTPGLAEAWAHNIQVGTCQAMELAFEAARRALSPPLIDEVKDSRRDSGYDDGNAGFLRPEASLAIVFVTDEPEQSGGSPLEFFQSIKGPDRFKAHGIMPLPSSASGPLCSYLRDDRILDMVEATGGTALDICLPIDDAEGWSDGIKELSRNIFGAGSRFPLSATPLPQAGGAAVSEDDILLAIDGSAVPSLESGVRIWSYDPDENAIVFSSVFHPSVGARISASYRLACEDPY